MAEDKCAERFFRKAMRNSLENLFTNRRIYIAECIQCVREYKQRNVHIRSLISTQPQYAFVGNVDIVRPSFMNNLLYQQRRPVRDSSNRRWIRCEGCGKIGTTDKFWTYGGKDSVNLGECYDCLKSRRNNS